MPRTVSPGGPLCPGGLAGLATSRVPGRRRSITPRPAERILAVLERPPPAGFARWTGGLIAAELGDVHEQQVWRFLRDQRIDLDGRKSWCESDDPEFAAKAADVVGLYMAPPENAIVICVDEKPSIQALERAQGYLKLPNGRALTGHSHDYKRHGTSTLFAALEVATGKVDGRAQERRRRVEFLAFMNDIVAALSGHGHPCRPRQPQHPQAQERAWLKRHPNVHFHFTPTRASWLNQVEIWFSILAGKSSTAPPSPPSPNSGEHIDAFIDSLQRPTPSPSCQPKIIRAMTNHSSRSKRRHNNDADWLDELPKRSSALVFHACLGGVVRLLPPVALFKCASDSGNAGQNDHLFYRSSQKAGSQSRHPP